jgi:NAD(P)-dependent dehydrogenase (short-subunit alcohol dehydrogenase family)
MELNGISAIVTGGASGLGAATVRALANEGVRVTVFDRNEAGARDVAGEVGANFVAGDVTEPADCQAAVDQAASGAPLRIAVNCAGTGWVGRVINRDGSPHDLSSFEFIQKLNVIGTFNVMTKAASAIAETEPGEDGERPAAHADIVSDHGTVAVCPSSLVGAEGLSSVVMMICAGEV